ncbi:alpha/beta fold hydrolase [Streptomyces sp. NRRL WC-3549]|uniref:alpha/beta fold hydrolase n=1 Tax=Streptomyces sp. NRRL WC-3549 TaxID=1463925 RepID=UPI0009E6D6AC|nr:alpha/beta hydrolase [Streptomyces sp. NRRL WC-3549]
MGSIYRNEMGRQSIRGWCTEQLDRWPVRHERTVVTAKDVPSHVVTAGAGATTVVFVPGTNFNAASSLPLATALVAAGRRVVLLDVPGQPGLSSGERAPSGGGLSWYGCWLGEVLTELSAGPVTVLGHSFGAAIAVSCASPCVEQQVLVSPGGLTRLRVSGSVMAASAAWYVRPTPKRSARLLRAMHAPGRQPRPELVEWMTLVARYARSSGAPGGAKLPATTVPRRVVAGRHDTFLPPRHLGSAVRRTLGIELDVVAGAGHLLVDEAPEYVAALTDSSGGTRRSPHGPADCGGASLDR